MMSFDKRSLFFAKAQNKLEFFKQLGLANLPEDKKNQIWEKFVELVSLDVLDKTLDTLSQKKQELLFLNLVKKPTEVEKFFRTNKKIRAITEKAALKIKKQIFANLSKKGR